MYLNDEIMSLLNLSCFYVYTDKDFDPFAFATADVLVKVNIKFVVVK